MIELLYLLPVLASPYFLGAIAADVQWVQSGELDITPATQLRADADAMAEHAVEYDLPAMPWYQLAAYWGRVADYTAPEPERTDKSGCITGTWTLKGTSEDIFVLEALRKRGIDVVVIGTAAHLTGDVQAIHAAEADYRAGWEKRRAAGGPSKVSVKRGATRCPVCLAPGRHRECR